MGGLYVQIVGATLSQLMRRVCDRPRDIEAESPGTRIADYMHNKSKDVAP